MRWSATRGSCQARGAYAAVSTALLALRGAGQDSCGLRGQTCLVLALPSQETKTAGLQTTRLILGHLKGATLRGTPGKPLAQEVRWRCS